MRLYKMEITEYPKLTTPASGNVRMPDGYVESYPKGLEDEWVEFCEAEFNGFRSFFLPNENKLYRSRSSARDKVKIVERWGGKARILEAEVSEFIPVEEANLRRKRERDQRRIEKLRQKIAEIESETFLGEFTAALKASNDRNAGQL
jgi:hypothetical protein